MMKKIIVAAIFLIAVGIKVNGQAIQIKNIKDITGRWEVAGEQDSGCALEIVDSNTILLTYMGEKKKILDYKIDFSHSPYWFDFSIPDTSSIIAVKSLLEVVGDSMIKWQLFVDEERTDHFSSSKGELFYLRRNQPAANTGISRSN